MSVQPEVEIRHRFDDPDHRLKAFLLFVRMNDWLGENAAKGKLMAAFAEDGDIVWRFRISGPHIKAFDAAFDNG